MTPDLDLYNTSIAAAAAMTLLEDRVDKFELGRANGMLLTACQNLAILRGRSFQDVRAEMLRLAQKNVDAA